MAEARVEPPPGWASVEADRWPVPGTPLAAWSGPGGASLVAYKMLPAPGGTAGSFGKALEYRLTNLPGLTVLGRSEVSVAGLDAARVEVVAPGTGDRLAPTGSGEAYAPEGAALVPTRRVVVAVPRAGDTFVMTWHAPESDAAGLASAVEATLATARLGPGGPPPRGY